MSDEYEVHDVDDSMPEDFGATDDSAEDDEAFIKSFRALMELARARGARDYKDRVDILKGMNAFKACGAMKEELSAYGAGWSTAMVKSILEDNKIEYSETTQ